jgi:hypothetical protein
MNAKRLDLDRKIGFALFVRLGAAAQCRFDEAL